MATPPPTSSYQYLISEDFYSSCDLACENVTNVDVWTRASTINNIVGQYLYFDSTQITPVTGLAGWHKIETIPATGLGYSILINDAGLVLEMNECTSISPGVCGVYPTQTPTNTPSQTPCTDFCFQSATISVTGDGTVYYEDCNGNPYYLDLAIGTHTIGAATCVNRKSISGSAPFTIQSLGPCCTAVKPTPTTTNTSTPTPTQTPNVTPTPTTTPTNSPSPTKTPTTTPSPTPTKIACGKGLTTGSHYYYDCCGNLVQGTTSGIEVVMNYGRPYVGVTIMNSPTSVLCPTPTTTPTASPTPTPSITPSFTPSPTLTSTPTPTTTHTPAGIPVLTEKNECDVVTLFPMEIKCDVKNPTSPTSFDGILSLIITGGTSPYTISWNNGQVGQTIGNMPPGSYGVTVVDFFGDFTANTVCTLMGPTASVTPSQTPTMTPTPTANYPNLCFYISYSQDQNYGPLQFNRGPSYNGRPTWSYFDGVSTTYIRWNINQGKWQFEGWTLAQGTLANYQNTMLPVSGWQSEGNPRSAVVTVTQGTCPAAGPLTLTVVPESTTCGNTPPYDGSLTLRASGGRSPYTYSIDNGQTFVSSNIFTQLANGIYNCVVRDATNNTARAQSTILADYTNISHEISVSTSGVTRISETNYQGNWAVEVIPPLPRGASISFQLSVNDLQLIKGPGTGTGSMTTTVLKNGTLQTTTNVTTSSGTRPRLNCAPNTQLENFKDTVYNLTISSGDIISGTTVSIINMTSPQGGSNGCATEIEQVVNVLAQAPTINNCSCCSVTSAKVSGGIPGHVVTYRNTGSSGSTPRVYPLSNLSDTYVNLCDACDTGKLLFDVYTNETVSPIVGMVLYTDGTGGVLSSPFAGNGGYYKFNWGGSDPSQYQVCVVNSNGIVDELIDCTTACPTYYEYTGCGYGATISAALNDATINNRTLYSNCNSLSLGSLCNLFSDNLGTLLTGYQYVYINSEVYVVNQANGVIIGLAGV